MEADPLPMHQIQPPLERVHTIPLENPLQMVGSPPPPPPKVCCRPTCTNLDPFPAHCAFARSRIVRPASMLARPLDPSSNMLARPPWRELQMRPTMRQHLLGQMVATYLTQGFSGP